MSEKLFEFSAPYDWEPVGTEAMDLFEEWRLAGRLGFLDLPGMDSLHRRTEDLAGDLMDRNDVLFVAGIGGSSLGLRAVISACGDNGRVRLIDSPDSALIAEEVRSAGARKPAICVITKSGGTAETLSIFMELRRLLGPEAPVVAITDPEKGSLRQLAVEKGWHTLPVPPNVGGRFSVLSPVGMFPATFAGVDTGSILRGAEAVEADFNRNDRSSLAGRIAGAYLSRFSSHPVHVFMPYNDRLHQTALWFAQLWAESLGKAVNLRGDTVNTGQTPLACRGPADQHSLVQLFMEGPLDKTVTVLTEGPMPRGKPQPGEFSHIPSMAYLQGRNPDELRLAEASATAEALTERGVPVSTITIPELSGVVLGQLFMALETATVLTGLALGINPLDQPGVERGKVLTYRAMGREGH